MVGTRLTLYGSFLGVWNELNEDWSQDGEPREQLRPAGSNWDSDLWIMLSVVAWEVLSRSDKRPGAVAAIGAARNGGSGSDPTGDGAFPTLVRLAASQMK